MSELYTKRSIEINYIEDALEEDNPLMIYLQRIKMLLFTRPGDVYGDPNFGIHLERLLFHTNLSNFIIKKTIEDQISLYCPEYTTIKTDVEVKFYKYTSHEECEISISLDGTKVITLKGNSNS